MAGTLGERNMFVPKNLENAAAYIDKSFRAQGHKVSFHEYVLQKGFSRNTIVMDTFRGIFPSNIPSGSKEPVATNIEIEVTGNVYVDEIILVGAHYDSVVGSPGANDNASGTAGLLEIGNLLSGKKTKKGRSDWSLLSMKSHLFLLHKIWAVMFMRNEVEKEGKIFKE